MPLATLHLLALAPNTTITQYLRALSSSGIHPLVASKPLRWIIKPEHLSVPPLLETPWSLLLLLPASTPLPAAYLTPDWVQTHWHLTAGIPHALLHDFPAKNARLLHPHPSDVPPLPSAPDAPRPTASSPQSLELTPELHAWAQSSPPRGPHSAVTMLNLLAFHPGPDAQASYRRYGRAFAASVGRRRGGTAKVVGRVVGGGDDAAGWDEVALAHYPSLGHFVAMIASEDYQAVNRRERVPALRETCILCTSEVDLEGGGEERARL